MTLLLLIFSICLPWLVGGFCLKALLGNYGRLPRLTSAPIALALGWGILSHGMLLLHILGITFSLTTVTLMQLLVIAVLLGVRHRQTKNVSASSVQLMPPLKPPSNMSHPILVTILHIVCWAFLAYITYYSFWRALNIPLYAWDSLASSIFNAKVFFYDGTLAKLKWLPYPIYPLHVPLICVWTSLCLGEWHDQFIKLNFPIAFVAFSALYYSFLCHWSGRTWALLGTVFLWSANLFVFHATISYRDTMLAYYTMSGLMLLILWQKNRKTPILLLAALLTGVATFIKLEGVAYMLIPLLLTGYICMMDKDRPLPSKFKPLIQFGAPCLTIFLFYYCYKWVAGISTVSYIDPDIGGALRRVQHSVTAFSSAIVLSSNWNIHWIWLFFSLAFNLRLIKTDVRVRFLAMALILFLGLHLMVSLCMGISANILNPLTISRLLIHFFPLVPLLVTVINADVYRRPN